MTKITLENAARNALAALEEAAQCVQTDYQPDLCGDGVEAFVASCHLEYIADNLGWGMNGLFKKRVEEGDRQYLLRIAQAIKNHFATMKGGAA